MKIINKKTSFILGLLFLIEALSFGAYFLEPLKLIAFFLITIIATIVTFKNLENGLLILFAELIIGSKGHLFDIGLVSIRMALFSIIILVYLSKFFNKEKRKLIINQLKDFYLTKSLFTLAFFVVLALVVATTSNTFSNILADFNAWLFFLLFFPVLYVFGNWNEVQKKSLSNLVIASFLWLSLKTLIILYLFTHNLGIVPDLYLWLRKTGVAEITNTLGSWPRIFLQSHIYAPIALVIVSMAHRFNKYASWLIATLAWSLSLISMSRSFWLAVIITLIIGLFLQLLFFGWSKLVSKIILISGSFLAALILIISISLFPIPTPGNFSSASFINRVNFNNGEAAVTSRWSLLPVLWQEIKISPFIGFGFGKTITYQSSDPRVLQNNPSGEYTTYAFEWGYLALWLKLGIVGLLAYLFLVFKILQKGFKNLKDNNDLNFVISLGLVVILVVNFFTPYLDHPLGIAYLLLIGVIMKNKNSVLPELEK